MKYKRTRCPSRNEILLIVTSLLLIVWGLLNIIFFALSTDAFHGVFTVNTENIAHFQNVVSATAGSLFTLVGFVLLFLTFQSQRNQYRVQQFESRLFELIKYHRDNVSDMTHHYYEEDGQREDIQGRDVFVLLMREFNSTYKYVCINLLKCKYEEDSKNKGKIKIDSDTQKLAIKISYAIFYLGLSKESQDTTVNQILKILERNKKKAVDKESKLDDEKQKLIDELLNDNVIERFVSKMSFHFKGTMYIGGHQSKLGFLLRHIYRTFKYIDSQEWLRDNQKQEYAAMVRAQISTYEQDLFFFDSIAGLNLTGKEKEVEEAAESENRRMLETYSIVRNISEDLLCEMKDPHEYFNLDYEHWERKSRKAPKTNNFILSGRR